LLLEYEGTKYHGFQIQNDVPTIQGELEKALSKVTGERIRLHGAGRTDTGVHAKGQVAAFETESTLSPKNFVKAINYYLPVDIAIKDALDVETNFDPRRDAKSREYRYIILNRPVRSAIYRNWVNTVPGKLNIDTMNLACESLKGERDCSPFTNVEGGAKNTVRNVFRAELTRDGEFIFFDMVANAFLPHQVRRTIGSLMEVGSGRMAITEFQKIANSGKIGQAKVAASPKGLYLIKVNYSNIGFSNENI
jgi:tRNA pseudouridine38-40 synthase